MAHQDARAAPESGQELIEFALVVPLLMLILFGVLDLGRAFYASITIANAAREGARYAMFYPGDTAGIRTATEREAQNSGVDLTDPAKATIDVGCPLGCGRGLPIRVTVTYEFQLILTMVIPSGKIDLMQYTEMMVP